MKERLMWVLWPGFVVAIPAVGLVFSLVDPADLHVGANPVEIGRLGVYTLGFLFFWVFGAACSALTCLLQRSPYEVNRCPLPQGARPEACPRPRHTGQC
jgi:hypothetical protein